MTQDLYATSTCTYFIIVFLHYALIFHYTHNYTLWTTFNYVSSFLLFAPIFIYIYDIIPNTNLSHRLHEITHSLLFWLITLLTFVLSFLPCYVLVQFQRLFTPGLKEVIIQKRKFPLLTNSVGINYDQVMQSSMNPKTSEATRQLYKQMKTMQ